MFCEIIISCFTLPWKLERKKQTLKSKLLSKKTSRTLVWWLPQFRFAFSQSTDLLPLQIRNGLVLVRTCSKLALKTLEQRPCIYPLELGHKLDIHRNALCTFNLRLVCRRIVLASLLFFWVVKLLIWRNRYVTTNSSTIEERKVYLNRITKQVFFLCLQIYE